MNIMSFISDVGITVALTILLNASRTGYERSETVINKLIVFTINTGLLTSLCAVMSLVTVRSRVTHAQGDFAKFYFTDPSPPEHVRVHPVFLNHLAM